MNHKHQIVVRIGEDFHCLSSPLSIRGHRADEVWIFGDLSEGWVEALAPLLAKVEVENIYRIKAADSADELATQVTDTALTYGGMRVAQHTVLTYGGMRVALQHIPIKDAAKTPVGGNV